MVPVVGVEPTRVLAQRILSPSRLPFHHTGEILWTHYKVSFGYLQGFDIIFRIMLPIQSAGTGDSVSAGFPSLAKAGRYRYNETRFSDSDTPKETA